MSFLSRLFSRPSKDAVTAFTRVANSGSKPAGDAIASSNVAGAGVAAALQPRAPTAGIARERLQLILQRQRTASALAGVDMQALQTDMLSVMRKYLHVDEQAFTVAVRRQGAMDIVFMEVTLQH